MKNVNLKTALTAVTLAAAAFATPLSASAADYRKCNDTTNGIAGGVIGGSAGAAIGESIAGRGNRTEGAILGAIIGGIAGAAVGDSASNCEKDTRYDNRRVVTTTNHYPTRTVVTRPVVHTVGYSTSNNRNYRANDHGNSRRVDPLYRIDREIEQTRREGDRLKREIKYARRGNRRGLQRALDANCRQLDYLKSERKRIKKSANNSYRNYW